MGRISSGMAAPVSLVRSRVCQGGKSGVLRESLQRLLHLTASPEEPRSNRPDRDAEYFRRRLVRLVLHVDELNRGPEWLIEVAKRATECRAQVHRCEEPVSAVGDHGAVLTRSGKCLCICVGDVDLMATLVPRTQERVPANREQP